ncbi:MAG: hypothetical protein GDA37_00260 [Ekhidna sp.]|nr:hypothetical protein [Ekhidna sp.]
MKALKMKKILPFLLLLILCTDAARAQQKFQIALGETMAQGEPSIRLSFSASENLEFSKYRSSITGSILLVSKLNPKVSLRYGLELRGSPIESRIRFEQEVNRQPESVFVFYDHDIIDINLPVDVVHYPKKWFYILGGIYPNLRIDWNNYTNLDRSASSLNLTAQQRKERLDQLKDHISFFGFNYRLGLGFRYKPVGIEFTFEDLLTNSLKDEFTFEQTTLPTKLKYSSFFIRLVFHFVKPIGTLLDWDMN